MSRPSLYSSASAPIVPTDLAAATRHSPKPSGSSLRPLDDKSNPLDTPTRPFTVRRRFRRASQPIVSSQTAFKIAAGTSDASDVNTNLYNSTSAESSADDDSDNEAARWRKGPGHVASSLEYLDLQFAKRFEATLADFSARGRARANEVVTAVHEAEDKLYQMALDLARNGQALIRYDQLPTVWKNNEHILSGYRFIPIKNWSALLKSTFQIHNETGNIHTHLWGLAAIIPLFWPSKGLDEHTTPMDRLVQTLYLIAAAKCLTLSVSWHVMAGCSDHVWFERFACVDYTGIAWLVAASILTTVYNGFYCQPNLALFYSGTTLLVGLVGAILPWASWFNDRENKKIRIAVFLSMCFTGLLPFSHAAFEHGLGKTAAFFSPILPSLAFYVGGLVLYALQFPESLAPGRFDLWGHSHQLWHIGIVLAIVFHYQAALTFHANRFDFSCALPNDYASATGPITGDASIWARMAGLLPLSSIWSGTTAGLSRVAALVRPVDRVFEKAGGMEGVAGLARADEVVHNWRRVLGTIGGGAVGRGWDAMVDWAQSYW